MPRVNEKYDSIKEKHDFVLVSIEDVTYRLIGFSYFISGFYKVSLIHMPTGFEAAIIVSEPKLFDLMTEYESLDSEYEFEKVMEEELKNA